MRTLHRTSLADRAYTELLRAIVRGELAPGERLRDKQLAERLGTSRTPVREALRRLADEGLVETAPNALTRVTTLDVETAAQAFPVVAALQGLAARLGVPALTARDLERMEVANREFRAAIAAGQINAAIDADDRFHGVLIAAARNAELERALRRVMPKIRRLDLLHFSALTEHRLERTYNDDILDACRRGAAGEAAEIVERSFLVLGEQVAAILEAGA